MMNKSAPNDNRKFVYGITQGGSRWIPTFISKLDGDKCTVCGRCRKICPGGVFEFASDSEGKKRMIISKPSNCIGCTCCIRVCHKKLMSFTPKLRGML
jgi:NAD-dependent dihydropyrimidine dehydrogenase PreA subunit